MQDLMTYVDIMNILNGDPRYEMDVDEGRINIKHEPIDLAFRNLEMLTKVGRRMPPEVAYYVVQAPHMIPADARLVKQNLIALEQQQFDEAKVKLWQRAKLDLINIWLNWFISDEYYNSEDDWCEDL